MKKTLTIVTVLFIVAGFGTSHGPSQTMEYISIAMMGMGTSYLILLILSAGIKRRRFLKEIEYVQQRGSKSHSTGVLE